MKKLSSLERLIRFKSRVDEDIKRQERKLHEQIKNTFATEVRNSK